MNAQQQHQIIASGEDSKHQFKREVSRLDSLAAELAAFSNNGLIQADTQGELEAWPHIELQDRRNGNEFPAVVERPEQASEPATSPDTGQVTEPVTPPVSPPVKAVLQQLERYRELGNAQVKVISPTGSAVLSPQKISLTEAPQANQP